MGVKSRRGKKSGGKKTGGKKSGGKKTGGKKSYTRTIWDAVTFDNRGCLNRLRTLKQYS